jgi:HlyD family secretion protein
MLALWAVLPLSACTIATQAPNRPEQTDRPTAVEVSIAKPEPVTTAITYTGTTAPISAVAVRSRIEGRLLSLTVDVGDRVQAGQIIAQLDDTTPATAVLQSEAEVSAREAEVAQVYANISAANARVEEARLNLQRAQADAQRLTSLAQEGAVPQKTAEDAQIAVRSSAQNLRAAQSQANSLRQAALSAEERVRSQRALLLQQQERLSYTAITAPIDGFVLERTSEPGNLLFAGNEVIKIGDLRQVKIMVMVSELEMGEIQLNSPAQITLDAIANRQFQGRVSRISPSADPISRQIPIEITLNNPDRAIGSGQLARVQFTPKNQAQQIRIPVSALPPRNEQRTGDKKSATIFVIEAGESGTKVRSRKIILGDRADGKVVVRSGLKAGEKYVSRAGGRLKEGDKVRISVLSGR